MQNHASRSFFDYWLNIKGDRIAPLRTQVDPSALRHLLPDLFIIAKSNTGAPTFRLAGTRLCDLFDRELKDQSFGYLFSGSNATDGADLAHKVLEYETPALLELVLPEIRKDQPYQMLLLPLWSTEFDGCDRVLGSLMPVMPGQPRPRSPVPGFRLRDWTFLTGSDAHFGVPLTADKADQPNTRRTPQPMVARTT
ncbi:PAS domain-containing protein [Rhizobium sp. NTR19]|uniref:PAS domain-containing protein n=1 Tax=Neorhizobium turbinariae TaxID=2937795 RepID=A0ABT0ILJ1_9HYPH|nr:PAS domain-containing protein [Neorhizobium turbinariae]MCK8778740.1 PAS domain-containing protein [Neorhizobium turbinariae]